MQKFLRFAFFLLRFIVGVTFILSGVLKLLDPVGTGLIINEYFTAFNLSFLSPASNASGIALSVLEFTTGIALLSKVRITFFSTFALSLLTFFTIVTFILYRYSPIQDCGCFGEAIHLSNAQTFYKNLILLSCIVPVFLYRRRFGVVSGKFHEWVFIAYHAAVALVLSLSWLHTDPPVEFGDFKVGSNLTEKMNMPAGSVSNEVYVYEKDGLMQEFGLDEIPDTTWHFVETRSEQSLPDEVHTFDFAVTGTDGSYITDTLIHYQGPVLLFIVHRPLDLSDEHWNSITGAADTLRVSGCYVKVLVPGPTERDSLLSADMTGYCDYKTLLSLSRSNGGVVYMNDGVVAAKYHREEYSVSDLLEVTSADAEHLISENSALENIRLQLLFFIILLNIVVFRYISGLRRHRSSASIQ